MIRGSRRYSFASWGSRLRGPQTADRRATTCKASDSSVKAELASSHATTSRTSWQMLTSLSLPSALPCGSASAAAALYQASSNHWEWRGAVSELVTSLCQLCGRRAAGKPRSQPRRELAETSQGARERRFAAVCGGLWPFSALTLALKGCKRPGSCESSRWLRSHLGPPREGPEN